MTQRGQSLWCHHTGYAGKDRQVLFLEKRGGHPHGRRPQNHITTADAATDPPLLIYRETDNDDDTHGNLFALARSPHQPS